MTLPFKMKYLIVIVLALVGIGIFYVGYKYILPIYKIFITPAKEKYIENKNINRQIISKYLEIEISNNADITGFDNHDNFFNEGYTILKIKDNNLLSKIDTSSNWKDSDDEYTYYIKEIKKDMAKFYSEINDINNYKWLYKNHYSNEEYTKYINNISIQNIKTNNFLISIYDIDNDILYYYHFDN